ncbi:WecB/TagA/CpsF family glycosyltransferase [Actinoplanes sp. NEAU-A12]|uniref:WecB/TagA/CpsF family glycosyltransferase n=1 Tax=Actinoplanes sandaracinus TaxID=3045177 RepID=A0ABT6WFC6_9ACTN|nr:WecB/TagA/CpsF family glycosyltransferase [Actinoplanes sandaracinus]MDI6098444.1 WecB/TagA/CpsF family glycosyltransferase [Actinoplanes sandaracinus]
MTIEAFDRVHLDGTGIDRITEDEVVAVVRESLARGRGGRIITPNVDILRRASADASVRRHLDDADLIVADGMPLIWASRLGGAPLPERVAGSSLIWSLSEGLGRDGRSIFVIGGTPAAARRGAGAGGGAKKSAGVTAAKKSTGVAAVKRAARAAKKGAGRGAVRRGPDGAARAAARLARECAGLRIAGTISPDFGFEEDEATYAEFCARVVAARPDMVFVGLGFPKQELVIERLRPHLPEAWFVGCGAAVNFVAGDVERAPLWMQRAGLEWAHRLGIEPRRLAGRYLRHDAPYALRLLARAPRHRAARR